MRRTKGSGSIRRRGGCYYAIANAHDPATGRRTQRWSNGCRTKLAAQVELGKLLAAGDQYHPVHGLKLKRLILDYLRSCDECGRAATTIAGYRVLASRLDAIGSASAARVSATQFDAFYARLAKRGLSPTTIAHTHGLLVSAFRWGIRKGRVNHNPLDRADPPRRTRSQANSLQVAEVRSLLHAMRTHRLEAPLAFLLGTGMRRGEVAGLRRSSVDMQRGVVIVRESRSFANKKQFQKATKTDCVREVPLGELASSAIRLARKQHASRKRRAGARFEDTGFVFTDETGHPLHPNALTDAFRRLLPKAGLPHKRLHDLRHTAGTLMLASGVDLNTVQQILGHSAASTTLNIYGHVLKGHKEQAIRSIDAALKTARKTQNRDGTSRFIEGG
jgi:integrase